MAGIMSHRKNWCCLCLRDRSYHFSSLCLCTVCHLNAKCMLCCVFVCVCGWGCNWLASKLSLYSLSLPFSIYLIAWAWGKVLIIFSFIQMNNPEALCTRVPSWETSHIWQRLRCFRNSVSLWVTGAPFFVSFNIQRAP